MLRNDCADNSGITVRITPESLCGLVRILHPCNAENGSACVYLAERPVFHVMIIYFFARVMRTLPNPLASCKVITPTQLAS